MKTIVEIEWDWPDEEFWLCPDNIAIALHASCPNTKFKVEKHQCNNITQGKREIAATWLKQYCKNEYCAFYKIYTGKCDCSDFKQCPAMQENDDNTK